MREWSSRNRKQVLVCHPQHAVPGAWCGLCFKSVINTSKDKNRFDFSDKKLFFSLLFFWGDQIQGFIHARQVLYHWAPSIWPRLYFYNFAYQWFVGEDWVQNRLGMELSVYLRAYTRVQSRIAWGTLHSTCLCLLFLVKTSGLDLLE